MSGILGTTTHIALLAQLEHIQLPLCDKVVAFVMTNAERTGQHAAFAESKFVVPFAKHCIAHDNIHPLLLALLQVRFNCRSSVT